MINRLKNKSFQLLIKTKVATVAKPLFDIGKIIFQKMMIKISQKALGLQQLPSFFQIG